MPYRAQLSSVNVIKLMDIDSDGKTDILTGGNRSGFTVTKTGCQF